MSLKKLAPTFIFLMGLILLTAFTAPFADGGGFPPTNTPSATPEPTSTPVPEIFVTEAPSPTENLEILAVTLDLPEQQATQAAPVGQQPSNIIDEQAGETTGGSPLILIAYMGLFIALAIGLWMLFGRRRPQNP